MTITIYVFDLILIALCLRYEAKHKYSISFQDSDTKEIVVKWSRKQEDMNGIIALQYEVVIFLFRCKYHIYQFKKRIGLC